MRDEMMVNVQQSTSAATAVQPLFVRTIIINPPNQTCFTANKDSMGGFGQMYVRVPAPPLDLPHLAAYLQQACVPLTAIEAGAEKWSVSQKLDINLADSLCLVCTSVPTIDCDLGFCQELRNDCHPGGIGACAQLDTCYRWRARNGRKPKITLVTRPFTLIPVPIKLQLEKVTL